MTIAEVNSQPTPKGGVGEGEERGRKQGILKEVLEFLKL